MSESGATSLLEGSMLRLTDENFDEEVGARCDLALVEFCARWSGPCYIMASVLDQLQAEYGARITVASVDVDDVPALAARFAVTRIPATIIFRRGDAVDRIDGTARKQDLATRIDLLLGTLDAHP